MLTGGELVARTLRELGAEILFSVSGNQILSVFDAAEEAGLRIIHVRHESAAAYAAAGFAELRSNQPGVALTSAGPGFLAALTGVAAARSMELPMLLLSGSSATTEAGAGGFQDLDQCEIARLICKETIAVATCSQIPSALRNAWWIAQTQVPGPVHVNLPADILSGVADSPSGDQVRAALASGLTDKDVMDAMAEQLMRAKRPLVIARPSASRGAAGLALQRLADHLGVRPVITESPRGLSDPKYLEVAPHYQHSDCVLAVCPADFAVGFLARELVADKGVLLQIDAPGDPQPKRVPDLHSQTPVHLALPYLAKSTEALKRRNDGWSDLWLPRMNCETTNDSSTEGLHPLDVAKQVRGMLRPSDVVVMDGGEFCQWIRLGLRDVDNRVLWNGKLGAIGGSIPMALGAALSGHSGRTICFVGDGAFGYHASEFETASRYQVPLITIVGNDSRWGAEWHLQAVRYGPERTFETSLTSARYDAVSSGLGATSFRISDCAALRDSVLASLSSGTPACLDVKIQSLPSPARTHVAR